MMELKTFSMDYLVATDVSQALGDAIGKVIIVMLNFIIGVILFGITTVINIVCIICIEIKRKKSLQFKNCATLYTLSVAVQIALILCYIYCAFYA